MKRFYLPASLFLMVIVFLHGCEKPVRVISVTTDAVTDVSDISCSVKGTIIDIGEGGITQHGFCYSLSPNPDIDDFTKKLGSVSLEGTFSSSLTGLLPNTKYYLRAFAQNSLETGYGNEVSFVTSVISVTDYDGNVYYTIRIGTQLWMQENLKVTHYANGAAIPLVEDASYWRALSDTDKAYCFNDNSTSNGDIYGALYTWAAAMNEAGSSFDSPSGVQGVCPTGWHLPSDAEWTQLIDYLGGEDVAGGKLKETGTTHWNEWNVGATNESGFTALPGGYRSEYGVFAPVGDIGDWWSTTEDSDYAYGILRVYSSSSSGSMGAGWKEDGYSVRCVWDN